MNPQSFDRSDFSPPHVGPNVFPNFFLFSRLVRWAQKKHLIAVTDLTFRFQATYAQLLTDVLHFRNQLRKLLPKNVVFRLDRGEEIFVILLGPAGYKFTVGFLGLMTLGAVIVPISPDLPVKEATYFVSKCKAQAVLVAEKCLSLGSQLEQAIRGDFKSIGIRPHLMRPCLRPDQFVVSSDAYMDLNKAAYVIFTSGTTGPPKGAVKRRGFLFDVGSQFSDQAGIKEGDHVLHILPVHHATGITVTLIPFLYSGGHIEFRSGGFDTIWTWERILKSDLDFFSGVPTIYMRLMQYYEQTLSKTAQADKYAAAATSIRTMVCGTSALPRPLQEKWTKLRGGKTICTRYGTTEFGNCFMVTPWMVDVPHGSGGTKAPGIDFKLTKEGELLIKSAIMFSKYVFDPEGTRNALDKDGYFKSGDIVRREGDFYVIEGRASVDIIKSGGYKISALDIEREILGLGYVSEVMVGGVDDEEYGQRVAAVIILREDERTDLNIDELRRDLRSSLAGYKMPTLLRVVKEMRKTASGKVIKKTLMPELFPVGGHPDIQRWTSLKGRKGFGRSL